MTQVPPPLPAQPLAPVCYRHPKRETGVRCTRCDRPICPQCMNEASVGFQCPECVSVGRRTQRQRRTVFGGTMAGTKGTVTIALIAVNVLVEIIGLVSSHGRGAFGGSFGGLLGTSTPFTDALSLIGKGEFINTATGQHVIGPYGVSDGEYYRLITSVFVQYGPIHLLTNMWALWIVGRVLESALGPVRYLVLYLIAGLGGSVAGYLFTPLSAGAGASGAIFGLFAALFVVLRRLKLSTSALLPVIVINVLISFAPGIGLAAHFGGLITGAVIAAVMAYTPQQRRNAATAGAVAAVLILFTIAIVVQTHLIQSAGFHPG